MDDNLYDNLDSPAGSGTGQAEAGQAKTGQGRLKTSKTKKGNVSEIEDPEGNPPLITVPDIIGWTMVFFVAFLLITLGSSAYDFVSEKTGVITGYFSSAPKRKSFESPASVLERAQRKAQKEKLRKKKETYDRLESRLESISNRDFSDQSEDEENLEADQGKKDKTRRSQPATRGEKKNFLSRILDGHFSDRAKENQKKAFGAKPKATSPSPIKKPEPRPQPKEKEGIRF